MQLGDIMLRFRSDTADVDRGFATVTNQANRFARTVGDLLSIPIRITAPALGGMLADMEEFSVRSRQLLHLTPTADTDTLAATLDDAEGHVYGWGQRVKDIIAQSLTFPIGNFIGGMVQNATSMFTGSAVGMNQTLETTTIQFTTLMKDADLAKQHVKDLFEFAKETPFETGPILAASRMLQTFGGNALNTKEEIRRLGDASAVASRDISEVGFWYGRMNSAIMNGQPFGEAAMRMQEMGILSGDVRLKLEAAQKQGQSGAAVWKIFTDALDKNAGAMKRQATTWEGLTSTIADSIKLAGADVFEPFFLLMKRGLMFIVAFTESSIFDTMVKNARYVTETISKGVITAVNLVLPVVAKLYGTFSSLTAKGKAWGEGFVKAYAGGLTSAMSFVTSALKSIGSVITGLLKPHSPPKILPDLDKWGMETAKVWINGWGTADFGLFNEIGAGIKNALSVSLNAGRLKKADQIPALAATQGALAELITTFRSTGQVSQDALERMRKAAGPAGDAVVQLANDYLRVEIAAANLNQAELQYSTTRNDVARATRDAARAQEDLNRVTSEYDAMLAPLSEQMGAIDERMNALRDQQRIKGIREQLKNEKLSGEERELLILEEQKIALRQQADAIEKQKEAALAVEEDFVKQAEKGVETAQKALEEAEHTVNVMEYEHRLQQDLLASTKARHQFEGESVDMAQQQVDILTQMAEAAAAAAAEAAANAAAQQSALDGMAGSLTDFKTEAQKMQDDVQKQVDDMKAQADAAALEVEARVNRVRSALTLLLDGVRQRIRPLVVHADELRVAFGQLQMAFRMEGVSGVFRLIAVQLAGGREQAGLFGKVMEGIGEKIDVFATRAATYFKRIRAQPKLLLSDFLGAINSIRGPLGALAGALAGFAGFAVITALGSIGPMLVAMKVAFLALLSPVTLIVGLFAGLGYVAATNTSVMQSLRDAITPLTDALQPLVDAWGENGLIGVFNALPGVIPNVLGALATVRNDITILAMDALPLLVRSFFDSTGVKDFLSNLGMTKEAFATVRFNVENFVILLTGMLRPVLEAGARILERWGGKVKDVGAWILNDLLPPITQFGSDFATMMRPHIEWMTEYVEDYLVPAIESMVLWLGENIPKAIAVLSPLVIGLTDLGFSALKLAMDAIGDVWNDALLPAFRVMGKWLGDLTGGWDNLTRGANRLLDSMRDIAKMFRDLGDGKLRLPDWLARAVGITPPGGPSTRVTGPNNLFQPGSGGGGSWEQRAMGGPVARGRGYIVGEEGPEFFVPPADGEILPNSMYQMLMNAVNGPRLGGFPAASGGTGASDPTLDTLRLILAAVNRPSGQATINVTMPVTVNANGVDSQERVAQLSQRIRIETRQSIESLLGLAAEQVVRNQR